MERTNIARSILRCCLLPLIILIILAPFAIYIFPLLPALFLEVFTATASIYIIIIFVVGMFFGRAYCYYVCPITGIFFLAARIMNDEGILKARYPKWINKLFMASWVISFAYLAARLIFDGGSVYHTPSVIILYSLYLVAFILTVLLVKNEDNHPMCPLIPFLTMGKAAAVRMRLPRLHLKYSSERCRSCKSCNNVCAAYLNVRDMVKNNTPVDTQKCFNCGQCSRACKFGAISYRFGR